ncbi:hypothetical protein GCM10012284_56540 [Mangrovihabitans endophyticus]|uniref:non-specific serine/threonine protein kinase n=2 Tax=Mangrovihabitans endophyticus TaxID=1751298 RepID=A0A8J3C3T6_9ACTN|nr:hypothetical protein GCM10012284_56540 [Mangrovihabitans endophyticus]
MPPADARPGEVGPGQVGRHRIDRLLGAGAFASVWLGFDTELQDRVAIKVLADNWATDLRIRERFRLEARLLRQVDSPRSIRVHTVGSLPDGRPYIVMEWAAGGSLRDLLDREPVPADAALRILREVTASVAELHARGIVHRDLTPGNVLLCTPAHPPPDEGDPPTEGDAAPASPASLRSWATGRIVVADLGLAKALAVASGLTVRAGTPGYMAPEQDDSMSMVDERADVYGLGRLGQRLLRDGGISAAVAAVLDRATERKPAARYRDAAAFGRALREAADHEPARRGARVARTALVLTLTGAVAAATIGIGVWWRERPAAEATDTTGRISVRLPSGWQARGSGWAGRPGNDGRLAPALVIAPDPRRWVTDADMPGAFIGLSDTPPAGGTAGFLSERTHPQCHADPMRTTHRGGVEWTVARYSACPAGKPQIVEAAGLLPGGSTVAYAQVTPRPGDGADVVDDLLGRLTLRTP